MHHFLVLSTLWMITCFIFTLVVSTHPIHDDISIDCGSSGTSAASDGRKWIGDKHPNFTIEGSSTTSSVTRDLMSSFGMVPYRTARISRSQFSYIFELTSGQKIVSLHFHPALYHGFKKYKDLFTVEAGPFTLMRKFSASITAEALGLHSFVKEFCIILEENQPLNLTFYPASVNGQSLDFFAFVNGIEIISVHESISYCHTGETGVQMVGQKSVVYIDKSYALEMVYRQNLKKDPVSLNDIRGRFGVEARVLNTNVNNITWRIPVDMGFTYMVKLHFCEIGLKMAKTVDYSLLLLIDHMIVNFGAEIFHKDSMLYKNYMVIAKGRKQEGKRDILISLQSKGELIYRHGLLEGLEIFKLSNPDNSLASPNPSPPTRDSQFLVIRYPPYAFGKYFIPNVFIVVICLMCIVVHLFLQTCETILLEDEDQPSTRALRFCRHFSLAEIRTATKNFNSALFIGKGGFGKVYKGLIDNGRQFVAIKRLKPDSKQGKREFRKEIETLSELRHSNLVPLIGYCNEQGEMILVYAYMPNGTLADHLYKLARKNRNYSFLSWEERLKICIGAGRGLDYLHTGHGVIHRDVKASNILLDETFVAKVSDFGLAKTEKERKLQSHDSSNPRGTFGYFDPDYFRTCKPTIKSDTYSFGVVLLEVICGRPAVDPLLEEYQKSLTTWALDNISRGEVDQIVDPSLRGEISPNSLEAFVGIVEKCLHDEPKKRPTIAHVVIRLEFALEQHINKFLGPNDIASVADILLFTGKLQHESTKLLSHEINGVYDDVPNTNRMSMSTLDQTVASSSTQYFTSVLKKQDNSRTLDAAPPYEKKDGKKTIVQRLSRFLPWDMTAWKRAKELKKKDFGGISPSFTASMSKDNIKISSATGEGHELSSTSNFRIFSLSELKAATRNFRADTIIGRGGFGTVYKGYLEKNSKKIQGRGSLIAIKRLIPESNQGFNEWLTEVNFLGKLSHPNLVKLFGYCSGNEEWRQELLLVYEFMEGGSLDRHLYRKSNAVQSLPWNIRLQILTGAARGLAYLHTIPVIYRDFKPPNILLDGSYNVKLSDFGLAKSGPSDAYSHITTQVKGTMGYTAPEYLLTGHLTVKSDVYGFGVILMEMLTGLRVIDSSRPARQKNLIEWMQPHSKKRLDVKHIMDSRLEGIYPHKSAKELYLLAGNCVKYDAKARPSMEKVVKILEKMEMGIDKPMNEPGVESINQVADTHHEYTKTSFYSRKHLSF